MNKYRLLIILSFLWGLSPIYGQRTADFYYFPAAKSYIKSQTAEAREHVDNGLKAFPDDIRLQKLNELLKKQQQEQNDDQQKKDQQKQEQQKQDEQKQEQEKQDEQKQQQKEQQKKDAEQQKKEQEQEQKEQEQSKSQEQEKKDQQDKQQASMTRPIPMTQQEAQRLLDTLKHEEKAMIFIPQVRTNRRDRVLKDW